MDSSDGCSNINQNNYRVTVKNRYEPLSDTSEDSDLEEERFKIKTSKKRKRSNENTTTKASLPLPPPPIVLHDGHSHKKLQELVKEYTKEPFTIKYTKSGTTVHTLTKTDRDKLIEIFKIANFNFHTYTDKDNKTKAFVIKGLSHETTQEELEAELKSIFHLNVLKTYKLRTKNIQPFYMVVVPASTKIEELNKINRIDNTKIYWEHYITKKRITQCHNCQLWSHSTSNCHAAPKCLKCAGEHATSACKKDKSVPAKCINCGGDHPANAPICPALLSRQKAIEEIREKNGKRQISQPNNKIVYKQQTSQQLIENNNKNFPPLPSKRPLGWGTAAPASQPQPQQHASIPAVASSAPQASEFMQLQREISILNSHINISQMITNIKTLNFLLANATNDVEKQIITIEFFSNLK